MTVYHPHSTPWWSPALQEISVQKRTERVYLAWWYLPCCGFPFTPYVQRPEIVAFYFNLNTCLCSSLIYPISSFQTPHYAGALALLHMSLCWSFSGYRFHALALYAKAVSNPKASFPPLSKPIYIYSPFAGT